MTADFNGDGFPDIAQSLSGGANGKIGINLGSSHGVLGATSQVTASTCANNVVEWVATGDVNGDGKADIVATMQGASFAGCQNNTVAVLIGQGTGKFKPAVYYPTSSAAQEGEVYLVDVNGDGKLDIVTENADGTISVLLNKGNGTYKAGTLVTGLSAIYPHSVYLTFADFNGDGKMDIGAEGGQTEVYVLLGTGTGTFGAPIQTVTPYYPITLAAADFDQDGKMDLLVTTTANGCTNNDRGYAFLKGLGNGTFTPGSINCLPYQTPEIPVVADLNGDGKLDVVIPYYGNLSGVATGPVVLQGKGNGTFTVLENYYSGTAVMGAVVADFNGDGLARYRAGQRGHLQSQLFQRDVQRHAAGEHFTTDGELWIGDGGFEKAGDGDPYEQSDKGSGDHQHYAGRHRPGRLLRDVELRNEPQGEGGVHDYRYVHTNRDRRAHCDVEHRGCGRDANRTTQRNRAVR